MSVYDFCILPHLTVSWLSNLNRGSLYMKCHRADFLIHSLIHYGSSNLGGKSKIQGTFWTKFEVNVSYLYWHMPHGSLDWRTPLWKILKSQWLSIFKKASFQISKMISYYSNGKSTFWKDRNKENKISSGQNH